MIDFLRNHLNTNWLRPENVVWDAVVSTILEQFPFEQPSLEIGCGNGITSFINAGGEFSPQYDWYRNVNTNSKKGDIYDACKTTDIHKYIVKKPRYKFTYGLDNNKNLTRQASQLGLYEWVMGGSDANGYLPYKNELFNTVYSNILYWLNDPKNVLQQINRILKPGGKAFLCIPDKKLREYCISYQWEERDSELLKLLNHGRAEFTKWYTTEKQFRELAEGNGFKVDYHREYLSKSYLQCWDLYGLRPIAPHLIKMANALPSSERTRIKLEMIETLYRLLAPVYIKELNVMDHGGFHFFVIKK